MALDWNNVLSDNVSIVSATKEHLPVVCEIAKENFSDPWSMASFEEMLNAEFVLFLVAVDVSERVVGYVVSSFVADVGEILDIAVDNAFKKRGIGGGMMDAVHSALAKKGVVEWFLEVRESNEAAKALYFSKGYQPAGVRKNYYRNPKENAILMKKEK